MRLSVFCRGRRMLLGCEEASNGGTTSASWLTAPSSFHWMAAGVMFVCRLLSCTPLMVRVRRVALALVLCFMWHKILCCVAYVSGGTQYGYCIMEPRTMRPSNLAHTPPRDRSSVAKRPLPSVYGDRGALASGKKPKKMAKLGAVRGLAVGLLVVGGVRPAATRATPVADKGGGIRQRLAREPEQPEGTKEVVRCPSGYRPWCRGCRP
jgi:hypothetical protein